MKKGIVCAAALLLAGAASAQVQGVQVRPLLGVGLTFGGDNLATVEYTNGNTETLHAGGLVHLIAGVDLQFTPMVSAQLNVGYHVDNTSGSNGDLRFDRVPVELLGHFAVSDRFRLGVGARFISSAKLSGSGVLGGTAAEFGSTTGSVVEGEYFPLRSLGIKARYVSEKYKSSGVSGEIDGSHVGVYASYYFF